MQEMSRRERERQIRAAEIVAAAEKVFSRKGFETASMDEIALEAQFTKKTIYQYFVNKEDLYFAVLEKGFKQLYSYIEAATKEGEDGFETICQVAAGYYQFYKDHPGLFRLFNYVGAVKFKEGECPNRDKWMQYDDYMFEQFAKVFEAGKADGSIRADVDAKKGAYSLAFLLTGYFCMLSQSGSTFTEHFALDPEEFALNTLNLLVDSLRPF